MNIDVNIPNGFAENNSASISLDLGKRKFLPWNSKLCGGAEIHGTAACALEHNQHGFRKCVCNPPPDQNFVLSFNLAQKVYEAQLHLCDKEVGNNWTNFAVQFCSQPHMVSFDPVQGPAVKKSFNAILRKARVMLLNLHPDRPMTPYETLLQKIIEEVDTHSRDKADFLQQKQVIDNFKDKKTNLQMIIAAAKESDGYDRDTMGSSEGHENDSFDGLPSKRQATELNMDPPVSSQDSFKRLRHSFSSLANVTEPLSLAIPGSTRSVVVESGITPATSRSSQSVGSKFANDEMMRSMGMRELELRERQLLLEESRLVFERQRWLAELQFREETIRVQAAHLETQKQIIFKLLEKIEDVPRTGELSRTVLRESASPNQET